MIYILQHKTENFLIKFENIKSFALNSKKESCRFSIECEWSKTFSTKKHMPYEIWQGDRNFEIYEFWADVMWICNSKQGVFNLD